jgi:hypothetical protein
MLLTEINETFKGIKSLLAKLFMTTDSAERGINHIKHALFAQVRHQEAVNRELVEIRERLKTLEQRQNFIYVTSPLPSPLPTDVAPSRPYEVTCCAQDDDFHPTNTKADNSPLGPFRERAPKTATTARECLEDDFNARANAAGTQPWVRVQPKATFSQSADAVKTPTGYVAAPRGERVPRYDYGNEL